MKTESFLRVHYPQLRHERTFQTGKTTRHQTRPAHPTQGPKSLESTRQARLKLS